MVGAPMPEAAVDQDGDLLTRERNVDAAARAVRDRIPHSITKAGGVQSSPQIELWFGVPASTT